MVGRMGGCAEDCFFRTVRTNDSKGCFLLSQKLTYFNGPYVVCGQRTMPAGKVLCPWVRFCACVRARMRKLLPISSPVGSGIHGYPRPQVELLSLHMKHSKGFMCNFTFFIGFPFRRMDSKSLFISSINQSRSKKIFWENISQQAF
jgi:hypothetical protein